MTKVCVLIRVYNRVDDLDYCVQIIRETWKLNQYYILVVSNGEQDGYIVSEKCKAEIDQFVCLSSNVGHFNGNSQLLLAGLNFIPEECQYTLILEADTWLYQDDIIDKYIKKLQQKKAVWASAQFFRYIENLATDFAIVNSKFVKEHHKIFEFTGTPEYYVAKYIKQLGYKFIYLTENMPISMPRYIKKYPYAPTGRFFSFVKSRMVTHHIESLAGKMDEKKFFFNVVSDTEYFNIPQKNSYKWVRLKMKLFIMLSYLLPYKSWIIKEKLIAI